MIDAKRRIAVVTGANRGIGLEICRELAQKDIDVVVTSRDESKGMSALGRLKDEGSSVRYHQLDITDTASIDRLRTFVEDECGRCDILVNSMCPGWVKTDMGGPGATRELPGGADTALWLATLPDDGPRGKFFRDRKEFEW